MQDKEFAVILNEEPLQPLALLPLTEDEQVMVSDGSDMEWDGWVW